MPTFDTGNGPPCVAGMTYARAIAIADGYKRDLKGLRINEAGYVRDCVLPYLDADGVWAMCHGIRCVTTHPQHVPTFLTHSVEAARDWVDGWLA